LALYGDLSLTQARELVMLHLGVWGPGPEAAPTAPVPAKADPTLLAVLEGQPRAELWVGTARPPKVANPAALDLLTILLRQVDRHPVPGLELTLPRGGSGPILLRVTAGDSARENLVPTTLGVLDQLRSKGFTEVDLDRARIQWRAERAALPLHPQALLQRLLQRGPTGGLTATETVTLKAVNELLAQWLDPAGLRYLLLGGDATLLKAAEGAGLGTAVLVKPEK
jgi:hypothetical protein